MTARTATAEHLKSMKQDLANNVVAAETVVEAVAEIAVVALAAEDANPSKKIE